MIMPCETSGGCGKVSQAPESNTVTFSSPTGNTQTEKINQVPNIPYYQMTSYVPEVPGTSNVPTGSGIAASTIPSRMPIIDETPTTGQLPTQEEVFQNAPTFAVPNNPLLPPGYQEILSYADLQYLNGFLRTQIGKYVRVEQLVGSNTIEDRYGYLVGVGINYILLQEIDTGNILSLDFYNIKYVYFYYTTPSLPRNSIR